jgi:hypothetical protein
MEGLGRGTHNAERSKDAGPLKVSRAYLERITEINRMKKPGFKVPHIKIRLPFFFWPSGLCSGFFLSSLLSGFKLLFTL